jgi:hypothetical protein
LHVNLHWRSWSRSPIFWAETLIRTLYISCCQLRCLIWVALFLTHRYILPANSSLLWFSYRSIHRYDFCRRHHSPLQRYPGYCFWMQLIIFLILSFSISIFLILSFSISKCEIVTEAVMWTVLVSSKSWVFILKMEKNCCQIF